MQDDIIVDMQSPTPLDLYRYSSSGVVDIRISRQGTSYTIKVDDDSLDRQLALLEYCKCSIYGASGAAVLPFFVEGAATFTQQTVEEGFRLKYKWERDLTNDLKNIKVFDKYHSGEELYESSPDELFEEFKKFCRSL